MESATGSEYHKNIEETYYGEGESEEEPTPPMDDIDKQESPDNDLVTWSQPDFQGRQFDPTDFEITDEEPDNEAMMKVMMDMASTMEESGPEGRMYYNETHGYTFIDQFELDAGGNKKLIRKFVPRIYQRIRTYKKMVPIKVTFNRLSNDTEIVEEEEDINEEMEVDEVTNTVLVKRKDEHGKEIVEQKEIVQEFVKDPMKRKKFIKLKMVNDMGETVEELVELNDDLKRTNDIMRLAAPFMKKGKVSSDKAIAMKREASKAGDFDSSAPGGLPDWFKSKDMQKEHIKMRVIGRLKKAREEQKALKEMNRYLGKRLCQFYDLKGPKDPNFNYDDRGNPEEERIKYQKRLLEFNDVVNFIFAENKKRAERITLAEMDVQQDAEELKKEKQDFYDLEEAMVADISPAEESKMLRSMTFSQLMNQQKLMDNSLAKVRLEFIRCDIQLKELQSRQSDHQSAIDSMEKVDFINYEALRVKTKDLNDKLDLKEKQVLMMKDRLTQRVQALAHVRLKSDHLTVENEKLRNETKDINEEINALRKECLQVQIERRKLEKELNQVTSKEGLEKYPYLLNEAASIEQKSAEKIDQLSDLVNICGQLKTKMEEKLVQRQEEVTRYKHLQEEKKEKGKLYSFEFNQ